MFRFATADEAVKIKRFMRKELTSYFIMAFIFGVAVNFLLLVSPIYMLQIYDRILTSGSLDSLYWLTAICLFLVCIYAVAESGRRRVYSLAGERIEKKFRERLFTCFFDLDHTNPKISQDIRALSRLVEALNSGVVSPLVDLPFIPLFLGVMFLVHPWLGVFGIVGGCILLLIAIFSQRVTMSNTAEMSERNLRLTEFVSGLSRQRSAIISMGMAKGVKETYASAQDDYMNVALGGSKHDGVSAGISRSIRQGLQIVVLGLGAFLALQQQVSAGAVVAGSILMGRALAPIDQMVGGWRQLSGARDSWSYLKDRSASVNSEEEFMPLPKPEAKLGLSSLSAGVPMTKEPLIKPFSVELNQQSLNVLLGANGSGKTTLLQTIAGAWPSFSGEVSLGGRNVHNWPSSDRGKYVGYLPQNVELMPGTVRQNISRFQKHASDDQVLEAAWKAGAHQMILSLSDGYDTMIGPGGQHISAGQSQSIGLSRAFFGNPVLILLDEPTSNLDVRTANRVIDAIASARKHGAIIIVSTHDVRLIRQSNQVLILKDGSAVLTSPESVLGASSHSKTPLKSSGRLGVLS